MSTVMKTVNQTFDWSRFKLAVRNALAENGRTVLLALGGIYLYYSAILISTHQLTQGAGFNAVDPGITFLFMAAIASLGFSGLSTKCKRSSYLTTPSSTTEKFTANALIYVIGGIAAVIACIYLADLTRIVVAWIAPGKVLQTLNAFPNTVTKWSSPSGSFCSSMLPLFMLNSVWYASVFMLGSILWPKRSFLKTVVAIIVYAILVFAVMWIFTPRDQEFDQAMDAYHEIVPYLDSAIIILCWVGGWFLFKRKDIISRRWRS